MQLIIALLETIHVIDFVRRGRFEKVQFLLNFPKTKVKQFTIWALKEKYIVNNPFVNLYTIYTLHTAYNTYMYFFHHFNRSNHSLCRPQLAKCRPPGSSSSFGCPKMKMRTSITWRWRSWKDLWVSRWMTN